MNRANQQALYQATNQGLLGIRQSEINYYQSLNVAFGTQAALIGGFTYGVFTQNQVNEDPEVAGIDILADVYWICSAITIALAVHVILCTMLMQVLGPGLSLNGPVGSMARATEGMRLEQRQIIIAFVLMMIMFSVATVLSCWVVMSLEASIGCSVAFAIAACYWYKYCERIYLRFYWDPDESGWNAKSGSLDDSDEPEPNVGSDMARNPLAKLAPASSTNVKKQRNSAKRKGIFSFMYRPTLGKNRGRDKRENSGDGEDNNRASQLNIDSLPTGYGLPGQVTPLQSAHPLRRTLTASSFTSEVSHYGKSSNPTWAATSISRGIVMEGYLTKRGGGTLKMIDFRNEPWERCYFTLTNTSNLFIYKNRNDYRTDPKAPIYTRPLRLTDYYIEVDNFDYETRETIGYEDSEQSSVVSEMPQLATHKSLFAVNNITVPDDSSIKPHRFQMTLILRENVDASHTDGYLSVLGSSKEKDGAQSAAAASRQLRYRDHWVLRCDTEEELQQWVAVMIELCPSCFKNM